MPTWLTEVASYCETLANPQRHHERKQDQAKRTPVGHERLRSRDEDVGSVLPVLRPALKPLFSPGYAFCLKTSTGEIHITSLESIPLLTDRLSGNTPASSAWAAGAGDGRGWSPSDPWFWCDRGTTWSTFSGWSPSRFRTPGRASRLGDTPRHGAGGLPPPLQRAGYRSGSEERSCVTLCHSHFKWKSWNFIKIKAVSWSWFSQIRFSQIFYSELAFQHIESFVCLISCSLTRQFSKRQETMV